MSAPRGTNVRSAVIASRLLESDLEFHSILSQGEDSLDIYGQGSAHPDADAHGQLEVWWTVQIDARQWGVKDIEVSVTKLILDGWWTADTDAALEVDTGETFHYEYPADDADPAIKAIGRDVDAPTPANILRMARPNWKVSWKTKEKAENRLSLVPSAVVDFSRHTIQIEF